MNLPATLHGLMPSYWQKNFEQATPSEFKKQSEALGQLLHYQQQQEQTALVASIVASPARQSEALASIWVDMLFTIGGETCERALATHAQSHDGSSASRHQAESAGQSIRGELTKKLNPGTPMSREELDRALIPPATKADGVDLDASTLLKHWNQAEAAALRTALTSHDFAPIIATDCDGTTWEGDIGETLFARAIENNWLKDEANGLLIPLLESYQLPTTNGPNQNADTLRNAFESGDLFSRATAVGKTASDAQFDYYLATTQAFAGHSVWTLKMWASDLFEAGGEFEHQWRTDVLDILAAGRRIGLVPHAVSASNQYIVEVAASYMNIPPRHAHGIRVRLDEQRLTTDALPPVTYGPGKISAIRDTVGAAPAIGIGDSPTRTDRELLTHALLGLAVSLESNADDPLPTGGNHLRRLCMTAQ